MNLAILFLVLLVPAPKPPQSVQSCTSDAQCGAGFTSCGAGGFCLSLQDDPNNCGTRGHICPDVIEPGDGVCGNGVCTCEFGCDGGDGGGHVPLQNAKRKPTQPFKLKLYRIRP